MKDACYCSEYQSSGIPCPPGKCPNVPGRSGEPSAVASELGTRDAARSGAERRRAMRQATWEDWTIFRSERSVCVTAIPNSASAPFPIVEFFPADGSVRLSGFRSHDGGGIVVPFGLLAACARFAESEETISDHSRSLDHDAEVQSILDDSKASALRALPQHVCDVIMLSPKEDKLWVAVRGALIGLSYALESTNPVQGGKR